jgi:hypothetical protein
LLENENKKGPEGRTLSKSDSFHSLLHISATPDKKRISNGGEILFFIF